ncbi:hypothetical protein NDU88_005970 [Pleurodeles waltl]|uniref:Uncharacterized protein n=1 Tax=Pleurodeles waltl TaxID=8319 RepID=A0AAV7PJP0_PLEWA|nr:hypothetical protein NDU88_005970 [Pleurodeles waltl]
MELTWRCGTRGSSCRLHYMERCGAIIFTYVRHIEAVTAIGDAATQRLRVAAKIDTWREKFPKLFTRELGCLKKFEHRIIVKAGFVPKTHKVRNVPLALREQLKEELDRL